MLTLLSGVARRDGGHEGGGGKDALGGIAGEYRGFYKILEGWIDICF